ncbi:MAG: DUF6884 domain-containing protein [Candidatus Woesearchaeota archaeon]
MKTLCIVPCGKKKIWDKEPKTGSRKAESVYIGIFAKKCKYYAKKFYPFSWCIISAKYGFLSSDDFVPGPYNVSFNDKTTNPISVDELKTQVEEKELNNFDELVVLGGKKYINIIKKVFPDKKNNKSFKRLQRDWLYALKT